MDYREPAKADTSESSAPETELSQQRTSREEAAEALEAAAQQHVQREVDAQLARQADAFRLSEESGAVHRPLSVQPTVTADDAVDNPLDSAAQQQPEPSQTGELFQRGLRQALKSTPLFLSPSHENARVIQELLQPPKLPTQVERVVEEDVEVVSLEGEHNTDSDFSTADRPRQLGRRSLEESIREADELFVSLASSIAARSPQQLQTLARLATSPVTVDAGDRTVRYVGVSREISNEPDTASGAATGARRRLFDVAETTHAPSRPSSSPALTVLPNMAAASGSGAIPATHAAAAVVHAVDDGARESSGPGITLAVANAPAAHVTTTATVGLPATVHAGASRWCSAIHARAPGPVNWQLQAGSGFTYNTGPAPATHRSSEPLAKSELGAGRFGTPPYPAFSRPAFSDAAVVSQSEHAAFPRLAAKFDGAVPTAASAVGQVERIRGDFERRNPTQPDGLASGAPVRLSSSQRRSRRAEQSVHFAPATTHSLGGGASGLGRGNLGGFGGSNPHQPPVAQEPAGGSQGSHGLPGSAQGGGNIPQMDQFARVEGCRPGGAKQPPTSGQADFQHRPHRQHFHSAQMGDEVLGTQWREQVGFQEYASSAAADAARVAFATAQAVGESGGERRQHHPFQGGAGPAPRLSTGYAGQAQASQGINSALGQHLLTQHHTDPPNTTHRGDPAADISQSLAGMSVNPPMWNFQVPQVSSSFVTGEAKSRTVQEQLLELTIRDPSATLPDRQKALSTLQNIEELRKADNRLYEVPSRPQNVRSFSMKDLKIMIGETDDSRQALEKILSLSKINAFDDASLQSALSMSLRGDAHRSFVKLVEHHPVREVFKRLLERYAQKPTLSSAIAKNSEIVWDRQSETIWQALARFDETMDDLGIMLPAESREAMVEQMRRGFVEKAAGTHARDLQLEHIKKLKEGIFWTSSDLARYLEDLTVKAGDTPVLASSIPRSRFDRRHSPYRDTHRLKSSSPRRSLTPEYYPTPAQRETKVEPSTYVDRVEPMEQVTEEVKQPPSPLIQNRTSQFGESNRQTPRSLSETKDGDIHNHIHCDNSTLHISGVTGRQFRGNSRGSYNNFQSREGFGYGQNRSYPSGHSHGFQQNRWNRAPGFDHRPWRRDQYHNRQSGWNRSQGYPGRQFHQHDRYDPRQGRHLSWDHNRHVRSFGHPDNGFKRRRQEFESDPRKAAADQSNWKPESKASLEGE